LAGIFTEGYNAAITTTGKFDHVSVGLLTKGEEVIPDAPEEIATALQVQLYPNPASGEVNIQLAGNQGKVEMTIYTLEGKPVKTSTLTDDVTTLNINSLQPGVYLIRFRSEAGVVTERLVVD
jgi:hypothetical protein